MLHDEKMLKCMKSRVRFIFLEYLILKLKFVYGSITIFTLYFANFRIFILKDVHLKQFISKTQAVNLSNYSHRIYLHL